MPMLSLCFYMEEFNPPNSLKSRYATKVVDNKFYGEIIIYTPPIKKRIMNLEAIIDNCDIMLKRNVLFELIKLKMEKLIIDHC